MNNLRNDNLEYKTYIVGDQHILNIIGAIKLAKKLNIDNNLLKQVELHEYAHFFLHGLLEFIAYFSMMLLIANLFPITSFDITLIIASIALSKDVIIAFFSYYYLISFPHCQKYEAFHERLPSSS